MDHKIESGISKKKPSKFSGVSENVKNIVGKAQDTLVNAVDKNGNGKIDAEDFGLSSESLQNAGGKMKGGILYAGEELKKVGALVGSAIGDARLEQERNALRPVFAPELSLFGSDAASASTPLPRILNIVPRDKKREESALCHGSVGYQAKIHSVDILHLYEDCAADIALVFYPSLKQQLYLADPCQKGVYVAYDSYFDYLKTARVSELEQVAQSLGAKHFVITFIEQTKTASKKEVRAKVKFSAKGSDSSYEQFSSGSSKLEVAADVTFSGNDHPKMPELVYFKNEPYMEALVQMCTGGEINKVRSKSYIFDCSHTTGMTEKEAAELDGVLAKMKCSAKLSMLKNIQRECRTTLEYKIEF